MLPIVALVGRPNVGKSTLFNRLSGSSRALVADLPGVTRDRRYGLLREGARACVLIDTGGVAPAGDGFARALQRQTEQAIDEADRLVLVADARDGCVAADRELHARLRRVGKPVAVAVNKVDGAAAGAAAAEFAELGAAELFALSAQRGSGVPALRAALLPAAVADAEEEERPSAARLAVVGRPNAGKSTLINRLLGAERLLVSPEPGTTRDSIDVHFAHAGRALTLVDTAGVRRRARARADELERACVAQSLSAVQRAQVALLVVDAAAGAAEQDAALASFALDAGRAVAVALNQCDRLDRAELAWAQQRLERRLRFAPWLPVVRTSGARGFGLERLLQQALQLHAAAGRRFPTPQVNEFLQRALLRNPPPRGRGGRSRVRYAHQGGTHPLRIVLHGARLESLPDAYLRYLAGEFRRAHRLPGVPVRFAFSRPGRAADAAGTGGSPRPPPPEPTPG